VRLVRVCGTSGATASDLSSSVFGEADRLPYKDAIVRRREIGEVDTWHRLCHEMLL